MSEGGAADTWLKWIATSFQTTKKCNSFDDLVDGIVLGDLLVQVVPKFFDASSIKREAENNEYLKLTNLKKIVSSVNKYNKEELHIPESVIDPNLIVFTEMKESELKKLLKAILGIVLECEDKNKYIKAMQQLDQTAQMDLMKLIEEILSLHALHKPSKQATTISTQDSSSSDSNTLGQKMREEFTQKLTNAELENEKLRQQLDKLKQDNMRLNLQNQQLSDNVKSLETEKQDLINSNSPHNTSDSDIDRLVRKNLANEKENMIQLKLQQELETKDGQIARLRKQIDELAKSAQENKQLKEEIDILKEKAAQIETLEDRLKKLSSKSEQVNDLKSQIKRLEEHIEKLQSEKSETQQKESKTTTVLKTTLDQLKDENAGMFAEKTSLLATITQREKELQTLSIEKQHFETQQKITKSKLENQEKEISRLNSELEHMIMMSNQNHTASPTNESVGDVALLEKIRSLEQTRSTLTQKVQELEIELEMSKQQQSQQAKELNSLKNKLVASVTLGAGDIQKSYEELLRTNDLLQQKHEELQNRLKSVLEENNEHLKTISKLNSEEVHAPCRARDKAMKEEKEKLEGFLRSAKKLITEERAKQKQAETVGTNSKQQEETLKEFQKQIGEKDKELTRIKAEFEERKSASLRENRLLSSAIYEIGLELQRMKAPKATGQDNVSNNQQNQQNQQQQQQKSILAKKRNDVA